VQDQELIYSYILENARDVAGQDISECLFMLLVHLNAPRRRDVQEAVRQFITRSNLTDDEVLLFINRCIYTAINPLHLDQTRHDDLKRLVDRLTQAPEDAKNPDARRARRILHRYLKHDLYQRVRRQARLADPVSQEDEKALGDLFPHYSFLFIPGAVSDDIRRLDAGKKPIAQPHLHLTEGMHRRKKDKIFSTRRDLSVYWVRRTHQSVAPIVNPTRLSNEELDLGIRTFNTRRPDSFKDRGHAFARQTHPNANMIQCRERVLDYMTQPLDCLALSHKNRLTDNFAQALKDMERESGIMQATVIHAFKKILDEMMFYKDKRTSIDLQNFKKYVSAITPLKYAAILLNLVLGCPMIIHKLEERLTKIYLQYEHAAIESLSWLVKFFEYMHLALVMNYRYYDYNQQDDIPPSLLWVG
jgi:hypothetical protein